MIRAENAIARIRRDLVITGILKWSIVALAALLGLVEAVSQRGLISGPVLMALIGGLWLMLSYRSMRGSRLAAVSPMLIAAGEYDQAEERIDAAMRSFSMFRTVKLQSLHHLAMLRHAQRRWSEAVMLCRALLRERLGVLRGVGRSTRLMLADALVEMGDVRGAYEAISSLYRERLPLGEALDLLAVQMDYMAAAGLWEPMMAGAGKRLQMTELMPGERAARTEALLALAARKTGRPELASWLRRRVELLADVDELVRQRPIIGELWQTEA
jgi:hypothetical protein